MRPHEVLSLLPRPVLVLRAGRLVYANEAFLAADGRPLERIEGLRLAELIEGEPRTGAQEPETWGRMLGPNSPGKWVRLWRNPLPDPHEEVVLLEEAGEELQALRLSDALVRVTARLLASRSEDELLQLACDALFEQGFFVSLFQIEGDCFFFRNVRNVPELVQLGDTVYGHPLRERRIPLEHFALLPQIFGERRAAFSEDVYPISEVVAGPELTQTLRQRYPSMKGLTAPILVDETPWGFLAIFAVALSPECASILEFFSQQLGSAIENVRHHATAGAQLARVQALQQELVAQERFAILGEAAGMLAHEVRNPLAVIQNAVSLLSRELTAAAEPSRESLKMIGEELSRLDVLVRDVLDAARPDELRRQRVDLVELVDEVAPKLQALAGSIGLEVSRDVERATTLADQGQIQRAIEKLVQNALQATPAGGTVALKLTREGQMWVVRIEDEGVGISPPVAERLFRPFFTTRTEGAGLGLTVALNIARSHGGSIRTARRQPKGSCFELLLPVLDGPKSPP